MPSWFCSDSISMTVTIEVVCTHSTILRWCVTQCMIVFAASRVEDKASCSRALIGSGELISPLFASELMIDSHSSKTTAMGLRSSWLVISTNASCSFFAAIASSLRFCCNSSAFLVGVISVKLPIMFSISLVSSFTSGNAWPSRQLMACNCRRLWWLTHHIRRLLCTPRVDQSSFVWNR